MGMLVVSRKQFEEIVIDLAPEPIIVRIAEIRGDKVRIGVIAPKEVPCHRREVYEASRNGRKLRTMTPTNRAEFGLVKSFCIDNGELDGLTPQECFVLGYELAQIDAELKAGGAIRKPVHAANRERIEASCLDAKRQFALEWLPGDESESWMLLEVA